MINIKLYSTKELMPDGNLENEYHIKVEKYWLEKISSDGDYFHFDDCGDIFKKSIKSLIKKYGNPKIINEIKGFTV